MNCSHIINLFVTGTHYKAISISLQDFILLTARPGRGSCLVMLFLCQYIILVK